MAYRESLTATNLARSRFELPGSAGRNNLSVPAALSLHGIPRDVVAVASAGTVRLVPLTPDASERTLLDQAVHAYPPVPGGIARPAGTCCSSVASL